MVFCTGALFLPLLIVAFFGLCTKNHQPCACTLSQPQFLQTLSTAGYRYLLHPPPIFMYSRSTTSPQHSFLGVACQNRVPHAHTQSQLPISSDPLLMQHMGTCYHFCPSLYILDR